MSLGQNIVRECFFKHLTRLFTTNRDDNKDDRAGPAPATVTIKLHDLSPGSFLWNRRGWRPLSPVSQVVVNAFIEWRRSSLDELPPCLDGQLEWTVTRLSPARLQSLTFALDN